jgi:[ribosomal protein S5]-alanine N-acetyltransferase
LLALAKSQWLRAKGDVPVNLAIMDAPIIVCETSRLLLRHFTMDDLDSLDAMHSDPEVARFIGGVKTREETRQRLKVWLEEYERYGFSKWAVVLRSSGELIGRCGLSLEQIDGQSKWELGWTFARAHWGHGYATEAAAGAMEHCFRNRGLQHLISLIRPGNVASMRVAERIGMTYDRIVQWNGAPAKMYVVSASSRARASASDSGGPTS